MNGGVLTRVACLQAKDVYRKRGTDWFWSQFFLCDVFCLVFKKYDALRETVWVYQSRLEHF